MGCCGKAKDYTGKAARIAKNTAGHAIEKTTGIKVAKSPHYEPRKQTCRDCKFSTWMKKWEYDAWLLKHGIEVLRNFTQLEKLPPLPKQDTGKNLYCTICKCFVPGKARTDKEIEDMEDYEKCPKGFWKN